MKNQCDGCLAGHELDKYNLHLNNGIPYMSCQKEVYRDLSDLYYEAHITIEPVFDERREHAAAIAKHYNFALAELLMKKRTEDTEQRSSKDTFMTGHSKSFKDLKARTIDCINHLKQDSFKVWRYKIEDTILDSRSEDVLKLL